MADMMSMLSIETKHLINKGFREENVKNPFISYMADKNSYSLGGKLTPMGVAFYIAPYVNAIVRSGTTQEKELVFESMLKFKAFNKVLSTKRGHKLGEQEQLVVQAVRTALNVKNRQTKAQNEGLSLLEHMIEEQNLLSHHVLLFLLEPGQIDRNIAGLIGNKFMSKYQKPCCILTRVEDVKSKEYWCEETGNYESTLVTEISYQGSARGCDKVGINNFKDICAETGCTLYASGHQGAFGLGISAEEVNNFISATDEILKDTPNEAIYYVDYIYDGLNVNPQNILDIASLDNLWGKDFDEALIAIENIKVTASDLTLMSPDKKPTLKITLPNSISLIKFNSSQEEYDKLYLENGYVKINVVGKSNANEWNGNVTPQIFIEDYEIVDSCKYYF